LEYVVQLPRSIGEDVPFNVRFWHGFMWKRWEVGILGVVEILVVNSTLDFEHVGFIVAQYCFPLYTFTRSICFVSGFSKPWNTLCKFISFCYQNIAVLQQKLAVDHVVPLSEFISMISMAQER
jgi:hypothetical protein